VLLWYMASPNVVSRAVKDSTNHHHIITSAILTGATAGALLEEIQACTLRSNVGARISISLYSEVCGALGKIMARRRYRCES
jgi:hypothetical protein